MYPVAIAAAVLTILCLETVHLITRRFGEKSLSLTLSPITGEQLAAVLEEIRKTGVAVESFTLTDSVAVLQLHLRTVRYQSAVSQLLTITKDYKVEVS